MRGTTYVNVHDASYCTLYVLVQLGVSTYAAYNICLSTVMMDTLLSVISLVHYCTTSLVQYVCLAQILYQILQPQK